MDEKQTIFEKITDDLIAIIIVLAGLITIFVGILTLEWLILAIGVVLKYYFLIHNNDIFLLKTVDRK